MKEQWEHNCPLTIEVAGEGVTAVRPDETVVTLGVVNEGEKLTELQKENAAAIAAIIGALTALGIARHDIATTSFTIEPQYDYTDGKQIFRGYKVSHLLQITLSGTESAGIVIDAAVAHGANTVTDVAFRSTGASTARREALSAAVRDAGEKALVIAATLGVSLSSVPCKVVETSPGGFEPVLYKAMSMPAGDASTTIEPGSLSFKSSVRVWYAYA
ncbi:SIMPL domain-containing protein [Paenibacillus sp. strain BS8-2]